MAQSSIGRLLGMSTPVGTASHVCGIYGVSRSSILLNILKNITSFVFLKLESVFSYILSEPFLGKF